VVDAMLLDVFYLAIGIRAFVACWAFVKACIGIYQIQFFFLLILAITKPLGVFMARIFEGERTFLHPVLRPLERVIYRLSGVREDVEQHWTGGTRVLSDWIKVKITSNPGETFLDRMIALVEGAQRQKTPNEIALNILIAGLTLIFLLAVATLQPYAAYSVSSLGSGSVPSVAVLVSLLVCLIPTTIGGLLSAIGIAGMDPRHAAQRAGDERQGGRSLRRRPHAAARQDWHHHTRQSAGGGIHSARRCR
jgi:hypothetical protein